MTQFSVKQAKDMEISPPCLVKHGDNLTMLFATPDQRIIYGLGRFARISITNTAIIVESQIGSRLSRGDRVHHTFSSLLDGSNGGEWVFIPLSDVELVQQLIGI